MKKIFCSLIAMLMLLMCFGCNAQGNTNSDAEDHMLDLKVFYVDNNEIKSAEERLDGSTQTDVIKKWLTLNELDANFDLMGFYINKGDTKIDELLDENDIPEYMKNGNAYIYDDIYEYYFNADINAFLEKPENALYADSLESTLDYFFDEIAKQNWVEDYWVQKNAEQ